MQLKGDEQVLDLGTGRGAVATLAAARVPRGKVVGIDTWTQKSRIGGNRKGDPESVIARRNADLEGVKVEFKTGDMRQLPMPGNQFDLVVSNLAVGSLTRQERLEELGMQDVKTESLGWEVWYGGPWRPQKLVSARKPRR
jgi:arsenite methyltransferase